MEEDYHIRILFLLQDRFLQVLPDSSTSVLFSIVITALLRFHSILDCSTHQDDRTEMIRPFVGPKKEERSNCTLPQVCTIQKCMGLWFARAVRVRVEFPFLVGGKVSCGDPGSPTWTILSDFPPHFASVAENCNICCAPPKAWTRNTMNLLLIQGEHVICCAPPPTRGSDRSHLLIA